MRCLDQGLSQHIGPDGVVTCVEPDDWALGLSDQSISDRNREAVERVREEMKPKKLKAMVVSQVRSWCSYRDIYGVRCRRRARPESAGWCADHDPDRPRRVMFP